MDLQGLAYALTQVAHNFGAVTVVAAPLYAVISGQGQQKRALLWLVLAGWGVQVASGVLFGLVSLYYYGQFPDIHGVAIDALVIKVLCAATAIVIIAVRLRARTLLSGRGRVLLWRVLAALGVVALTAAAFLRWFS